MSNTTTMNKSDDFFKGLLFGAAIGAAAGILLAPRSGQDTRKEIKRFASDVGDKVTHMYEDARYKVEDKVADIKRAGKKINYNDYKKLIQRVVDEIKQDSEVSEDVAQRLGERLNEDWNEIKEEIS